MKQIEIEKSTYNFWVLKFNKNKKNCEFRTLYFRL